MVALINASAVIGGITPEDGRVIHVDGAAIHYAAMHPDAAAIPVGSPSLRSSAARDGNVVQIKGYSRARDVDAATTIVAVSTGYETAFKVFVFG